MQNLSYYQQWQLEKYGNVISCGNSVELENGLKECTEFNEKVDDYFEQQNLQYER